MLWGMVSLLFVPQVSNIRQGCRAASLHPLTEPHLDQQELGGWGTLIVVGCPTQSLPIKQELGLWGMGTPEQWQLLTQ